MQNKIAWAAGLFDGDGCICISRKNKWYQLSISITLSHKVGIEKFAAVTGFKAKLLSKSTVKNKALYYCKIIGFKHGVPLLKNMLPFLFTKKEEAILIINLNKNLQNTKEHNTKKQLYESCINKLDYLRSKKFLASKFDKQIPIKENSIIERKIIHSKNGRNIVFCKYCNNKFFSKTQVYCSMACRNASSYV